MRRKRSGKERRKKKREREREERQLSKVQSSGHGAGHYMGFWGYRGGNRLPWDRSFSSSFFPLYPTLLLPPPPPPPAAFPRLLTHPIKRALPTPEFIPGGCYGDAPSSEWRQGIQRRRELWNEKYMVSERTAVGRFSRGANGHREDGRRGRRGRKRAIGEEKDARIRGEEEWNGFFVLRRPPPVSGYP